jgi:hypothetical protein
VVFSVRGVYLSAPSGIRAGSKSERVVVLGLFRIGVEIVVRMRPPSTLCTAFLQEMFWKIKQLPNLGGVAIPLPQRVIRYAGARPQEE